MAIGLARCKILVLTHVLEIVNLILDLAIIAIAPRLDSLLSTQFLILLGG